MSMEEDLILDTGEEWEDYVDYHETIATSLNVLTILGDLDKGLFSKKQQGKIEESRDIALHLICRSMEELVKQFDEAHE